MNSAADFCTAPRQPPFTHETPGRHRHARDKLTGYLLRKLPENDKSGFLALAGYTPETPERLETGLRAQILTHDADFIETTEYGGKYRIRGDLTGPNGRRLRVLTIWLMEDATGNTKFITLYPAKTT